MLRVECIREASKLESLKDDFDLLSNGATMRRLSWLIPWWNAYQANYKLHVLVAYRGERVCGIFPLAETTMAVTGRCLVFMGSGKVCSDDLGILADLADAEEVADAFATWLVQSQDCCHWDHLDLDGVRENNASMAYFGRSLEAFLGSHIERKPGPNCWATSLEGGFDSFRSRLTKRARKIVRVAESAIDSGTGIFEIAQTPEQALEFVCEIEAMHQARWKERGIDGCFSRKEFACFLNNLIDSMWQDPWMATNAKPCEATSKQRVLVGLVRIQGAVAAGSICFHDRDSMAMYLVGMNPEFAENRPGWTLNTCFIKHAIELGCSKLDFLRGDEEYKGRLGGVPFVQQRWIMPSNRVSSQVRNVAYRTAVGLKTWWNTKTKVIEPRVERLSQSFPPCVSAASPPTIQR